MSACPHCHRDTLGYWARAGSHRSAPVRCKSCGGLSRIQARPDPWWYWLFAISSPEIAIVVALVAVILSGSFWLGGAIVAASVLLFAARIALDVRRTARQPMVAMTREEAAEARHHSFLFACVLLMAAIAVVAYQVLAKW